MSEQDNQFIYNIPRLNFWFAITSVILLVSVGWLVLDDYAREWKRYQRQFRDLDYVKTRARIEASEQGIDPQALQTLEAGLEAARAEVEAKDGEIRDIDRQLAGLEAVTYRATQDYQFTKAELAQAEFFLNEALKHDEQDAGRREQEIAELSARLAASDDEVKRIAAERSELEGRRTSITDDLDRARADLDRLHGERDRLRKKLAAIEYNFINVFRNLPIVDFMNPSLRIQQLVQEDIVLDISFLEIPKVDRCTTCHLGIDREDFEGEIPPFNAHPRLDLMVASGSAHPKESFGCTGCHQGLDRATSFVRAAHTPSGPRTAEEWEDRYGWHRLEHWEYPMHEQQYAEAGCYKCHSSQVEVPGAEKLNRGLHLFAELGCHGCHKVEGLENLPRIGPDLYKVASKTDRDWMYRWIANPTAFRPTTKMPRYFFTANRSDEDDFPVNHAEIEAITTYLMVNSENPSYPPVPPGNAARGRELSHRIGCQGCHLVIEAVPEEEGPEYGRHGFGPNLNRIGEKVDAGWLFQWLQNPRQYFPGSRMPDLRLTRQEAADLTAYLMGLRSPEAGAGPGPEDIDAGALERALDELMTVFLRRDLTREQVEQQLRTYSDQDKRLFLGERLIARYGCAGCHGIAGFENAQRIGVELTEEGHKNVRKFDFGALDIDHTVPAWLFQKMKNSRLFDVKRRVAWENKLRMPNYALTDEEAESVTTLLLGFQKRSMVPKNAKDLSAADEAIEAGRRLLKTYNCRGCHIIEGRGGEIRDSLARELQQAGIPAEQVTAFAPPDLYREGSKVQPEWLFGFLHQPETIRPWLQVRMPSFRFTDTEATVLGRYFALVDGIDFPFSSEVPEPLAGSDLRAAETLFSPDYLNCGSCHQQGARKPEGPPSGWAPDFTLARRRLRPAWIQEWLRDPQALMPGTKMPGYFTTADSGPPDILGGDEDRQIEILTRYLLDMGS